MISIHNGFLYLSTVLKCHKPNIFYLKYYLDVLIIKADYE